MGSPEHEAAHEAALGHSLDDPRSDDKDGLLQSLLRSFICSKGSAYMRSVSIEDAKEELIELIKEREERKSLLESFDLKGIAQHMTKEEKPVKNVIVMCGAGVSVSAGIPDFRTPGTGLYDNLQKYNLPFPQAVFELNYFQSNPEPFFKLAKELYPGLYTPTPTHCFLRLLEEKGVLLRCFTQNIDSLESVAGVSPDKVVAAHGNFDSSHCTQCHREADNDYVRTHCLRGEVCRCPHCDGLVKPDIVFFGENLPHRFYSLLDEDFPKCDLLVVMGTSLAVAPFCTLVDHPPDSCPRVLINREKVGEMDKAERHIGLKDGFDFREETGYRDVLYLGDCDSGVRELAGELGWAEDLERIVEEVRTDMAKRKEAAGEVPAAEEAAEEAAVVEVAVEAAEEEAAVEVAEEAAVEAAEEAAVEVAEEAAVKADEEAEAGEDGGVEGDDLQRWQLDEKGAVLHLSTPLQPTSLQRPTVQGAPW